MLPTTEEKTKRFLQKVVSLDLPISKEAEELLELMSAFKDRRICAAWQRASETGDKDDINEVLRLKKERGLKSYLEPKEFE